MLTSANRILVSDLALRHKLPGMFPHKSHVEAGGQRASMFHFGKYRGKRYDEMAINIWYAAEHSLLLAANQGVNPLSASPQMKEVRLEAARSRIPGC
jgi:hypothetical protein